MKNLDKNLVEEIKMKMVIIDDVLYLYNRIYNHILGRKDDIGYIYDNEGNFIEEYNYYN
jgi:hypothetical protein